ncbi:MAG TPA: hypothetical protein VK557_19525 [Pyrinomonadaceae bacterium]|nr:hypothetical protein [Pyrinomonadaceae bacterium]
MSDEEFIRAFEACTLPADRFHHPEHVRVVWLYLHRYSVLETLARFCESLKRFASANGKATLYHETISWAYVFLIHERMARSAREQTWPEFIDGNIDLFDWQTSILKSYYRDVTLKSELARKTFVLPDRFEPHSSHGDAEVQ